MPGLTRILVLIFLAGSLTVCLFGFAILNHKQIEIIAQEDMPGCGTVGIYLGNLSALGEQATRGQVLFNQNCKTCHKLNQEVVGPALGTVFARRDSLWLRQMIVNGDVLVRMKDKTALELYNAYGKMKHIDFTVFKTEDVNALMIYLKEIQDPGIK